MYYHFRMTVVSKTYRNQTNTVDQYYGTQYSVFKIPEQTLNVNLFFTTNSSTYNLQK